MVTRIQHRHDMMRRLSSAACDLFESKGLAATLEEIAKRAGVSRRTVFRYIDHKEDLAFLHPRIWLDVLGEAQNQRRDDPVRDRLLHGARMISDHIDRDPEPVRRAMAVAQAIPALAKGNAVVQQLWIERLTDEIGRGRPSNDQFRSHILAAAIMGVINAAMIDWFRDSEDGLLVDYVDRGLEFIAPILP